MGSACKVKTKVLGRILQSPPPNFPVSYVGPQNESFNGRSRLHRGVQLLNCPGMSFHKQLKFPHSIGLESDILLLSGGSWGPQCNLAASNKCHENGLSCEKAVASQ
jgi:hypothetical protein